MAKGTRGNISKEWGGGGQQRPALMHMEHIYMDTGHERELQSILHILKEVIPHVQVWKDDLDDGDGNSDRK